MPVTNGNLIGVDKNLSPSPVFLTIINVLLNVGNLLGSVAVCPSEFDRAVESESPARVI